MRTPRTSALPRVFALSFLAAVHCTAPTQAPAPVDAPARAAASAPSVPAALAEASAEAPSQRPPDPQEHAAPSPETPPDAIANPAFDLFCLVQRGLAEGAPEWKLLGCPATPRALPVGMRPKVIFRSRADAAAKARTSLTRVDFEFDEAGRVTEIRRSFEDLTATASTFEYAEQGLLAIHTVVNDKARSKGLRGTTTSFATDGSKTILRSGAVAQVLAHEGPGGWFDDGGGRWVFGPRGGTWEAARQAPSSGTSRLVLELAEGRLPRTLKRVPEIELGPEVYTWKEGKLVETAYRGGVEPGETVVY